VAHQGIPPVATEAPTGEWPAVSPDLVLRNWRTVPPDLRAPGVTLREVEPADAHALLTLLSAAEVARVIWPPPGSAAELAARIDAARVDRLEGRGVCLSVVPEPHDLPVGLFRVREIESGFGSAEWEFVLSPEHWGHGLFFRVAPLVVDFVFDVLGAERLEARTALTNGRSQGALRKLGAVREAVLRRSRHRPDRVEDQTLWAILAVDWQRRTGRRAVH
jgi:RimJ/RimL family protein N-acetyltransferase